MGIFKRNEPGALDQVDLGLDRADRVLAVCPDRRTSDRLVISTHRLSIVTPDGEVRLQKPWHLVDNGSYDNEADVLSVTWVDRAAELALRVGGDRRFLTAFRERVTASVVIVDTLELGRGRSAKLVIRKDLARDALLDQVILGPGVRLAHPGVRERVERARRALREQVGLT